MRSIYDISKDLLEIKELLIENGGEISEETENKLIISEQELEVKAANYGMVIKDILLESEAIDKAIQDLQAKQTKRAKTILRLKETVSNAMQSFGITKVETPTVKISFRKSSKVVIEQEDLIPKKFIKEKVSTSIDKTELKKALKEGNVLGASIEETQNIQIK